MALRTKRKFSLQLMCKKKLSKEAYEKMSDLYDELYEKADAILKKYNPCNIKNGRCLDDYPCCEGGGCEFFSKTKGCLTKSLGCKLALCDKARKKFRDCAKELDRLKKIAEKNPYLPVGYQSIKEDVFFAYVLKE